MGGLFPDMLNNDVANNYEHTTSLIAVLQACVITGNQALLHVGLSIECMHVLHPGTQPITRSVPY